MTIKAIEEDIAYNKIKNNLAILFRNKNVKIEHKNKVIEVMHNLKDLVKTGEDNFDIK